MMANTASTLQNTMITNNLSGSSLMSYLQTQLTAATVAQDGGATGTRVKNAEVKTNALTANATKAALSVAGKSHQAVAANAALNAKQFAMADDMRMALQNAGVELDAGVTFTRNEKGSLAIGGSDSDRAKVAAFLKADLSRPSMTSRLTSLGQTADALSSSIQQRAAVSQAARYAGNPGGVMSLYSTLSSRQDNSSPVFSLSASSSSITFPGMLSAAA